MRKIDHNECVGTKLGKLLVSAYLGRDSSNRHMYKCKCDCGREIEVSRDALFFKVGYKNKTSCGICDNPYMLEAQSHIGEKHGRLTIVGIARKQKKNKKHEYYYTCKCDCGNMSPTPIPHIELLRGHTRSCGCLSKEVSSINGSKNHNWMRRDKKWYLIENGKRRKCKSSLEVLFASFLNFKSIPFKYEPTIFRLEGSRRYKPDFYLPTKNRYYEIKGFDGNERQRETREMFQKLYKLFVVSEKDLLRICKLRKSYIMYYFYQAKKLGIPREKYFANFFRYQK